MMAAWSIKYSEATWAQKNTHDQLAMSVTLVSDWYHWLSLVTLCKDVSQRLCRNFWTYGSPLIKKVPRLAREGKHAEAGIPVIGRQRIEVLKKACLMFWKLPEDQFLILSKIYKWVILQKYSSLYLISISTLASSPWGLNVMHMLDKEAVRLLL